MTDTVMRAGKIDIQDLTLISGGGKVQSLLSFLTELNLYEDIYSGGLYGNVGLTDSAGLMLKMSMAGEEYLTIKFDTPGFSSPIYKTFRCCSVQSRSFIRDTTTEGYVIHFVSPEVYLDHYLPVQRAFSGPVEDIVVDIYQRYLCHPRNFLLQDGNIVDSEDYTNLVVFTECTTPIKFVSPSWSPMKCLSWLASKVTSSDTTMTAPNFMFFESNKAFYWGSMEDMVKSQREKMVLSGIYYYTPGNTKSPIPNENANMVTVDNRIYKAPDIARDYMSIHELVITENIDTLKNLQTGYLASVYHELDVTSRTYTEKVYDHVTQYPYYNHTSTTAKGFFADEAVRTPYSHQIVGFKHTGLFDNAPNNLNERAKDIMPARNSLMQELNQVKMKIDVFGRSDIELGGLVYINYPKAGPKEESDKSLNNNDPMYSGLYIITAIHHKITLENYLMTLEIVKDSFGDSATAGLTT